MPLSQRRLHDRRPTHARRVGRCAAPALACLSLLLATNPADSATPIGIYAAGSLSTVIPAAIAASGLPPGTVAPPVFGPAGALAHRLQAGEHADLFASADLAQPLAVTRNDRGRVVAFARNRMCILSSRSLGLTPDTLLQRLLSPALRLVTSIPVTDPGGDYALAVFDRADALHPGAGAVLRAKALHLLGGKGHGPAALLAGHAADAVLVYCSAADVAARAEPALVSQTLPPDLSVTATYGLAVLSDRTEAARLALFLLSEQGQSIIEANGLLPLLGR